MAKKLGKNFRLYVSADDGTTFSEPKGQGNLTINRNPSTIDTSTKDDGEYGTSAPGAKALTITAAFIPDLPDVNGYSRMKALDASSGTTTYQVREKPYALEDAVFECVMYTSFGDSGFNRTDAVGTTATLSAAQAPTQDDI